MTQKIYYAWSENEMTADDCFDSRHFDTKEEAIENAEEICFKRMIEDGMSRWDFDVKIASFIYDENDEVKLLSNDTYEFTLHNGE